MLIEDIGEFNLIKRIQEGLGSAGRPVIVGIGDDSAVLPSSADKLQLVTTDMLVEDVHFSLDIASPYQIGWKSLAVNISDIAAMGGEPTYALVSIGLPRGTAVDFVSELYAGMRKVAGTYSVDIVGGDTVLSPQIVINISLLGEVEPGNCILRSGARPGNAIAVTGDLGGSSAGLAMLKSKAQKVESACVLRHLMPTPRVCEGRLLAKSGFVTSMIDISDGLASEIHHICEESRTGAKIYLKDIPLSDGVPCNNKKPYDFALYGGEDYELLFTCQPDKVTQLKEIVFQNCGTTLTIIGRITDTPGSVIMEDESGDVLPLSPLGYDHFLQNT